MRAILFASATRTSVGCLRKSKSPSQVPGCASRCVCRLAMRDHDISLRRVRRPGRLQQAHRRVETLPFHVATCYRLGTCISVILGTTELTR